MDVTCTYAAHRHVLHAALQKELNSLRGFHIAYIVA